jgi:hypothetical protein
MAKLYIHQTDERVPPKFNLDRGLVTLALAVVVFGITLALLILN